MRNIILLIDKDGSFHAYGSIVAMLDDPGCPFKITARQFNNLKEKGWPVQYADCTIHRLPLLSTSDVSGENETNQVVDSGGKSSFSPVQCHFELYVGVEGTAAELASVVADAEPLFKSFADNYGLEVVLFIKIGGMDFDPDEIDWSFTKPRTYRYQAIYDGKEMYENQAKRILKAAEEFRKYHKYHWHEQWIKPLLSTE